LRSLFPVLAGAAQQASASEIRNSAFRDRRVCHPMMFNMYFAMSLDEVELTRRDVEDVINATADAGVLYERMLDMRKRGAGGLIFDTLSAHVADIPVKNLHSFIQGLARYVNEAESDQILNIYDTAEDLILKSLRMIDDLDERGLVATAALSNSVGLPAIEFFTTRELHRLESGQSVVDANILEALRTEVLRRIRESASDDSLVREKALWQTLLDWSKWADLDEVRRWVDKITLEPTNIIPFLRGIIHRSYTVAPVRKTNYYISRGLVEQFISMEILKERVDRVEIADDEVEWIIGLFNDAFAGRGDRFE
jgi:hypothetical protein